MKLTVDLALKMSAATVVDVSGKVHREFDSLGKTPYEFAEEIAQTALDWEVTDVILEDVPFSITGGQGQVKPVFRLQGVCFDELVRVDLLDRTWMLNPSTWQLTFPGVGRAPKGVKGAAALHAREAAARAAALSLGYEPPPLVQNYIDSLPVGTRVLKKNTAHLAKVETDYIDARLIAEWANSFETPEELHSKLQAPPSPFL